MGELMALHLQMAMTKQSTAAKMGYQDKEYYKKRGSQIKQLDILNNYIKLMFNTSDENYKPIKNAIDTLEGYLVTVNESTMGLVGIEQLELRKLFDNIVERQRQKIAELDSKNPLI